MFTGIIQKLERIKSITKKNQSILVEVKLPRGWKLKKGESVSINGVCSTVCEISKSSFRTEYMPETINKTTVSEWKEGYSANLERSLKMSDFLGGHLISGHVDQKGKITRIDRMGDSRVVTIKVIKDLIKFIAPKGSVALDGISLTVVDVFEDTFTVSLVNYTLLNTNFSSKKLGELVNVETDLIAKYIFNILKNNTNAKEK